MKKLAGALLALLVFSSAAASAHPYHFTHVSWIVATRDNLSVDDRYVTIIGHVTRRMGSEEYWFHDSSGSVRLDSENFDLPIGPKIIIGGRIDQAYLGFGHIEVDVRRWSYAPRPSTGHGVVMARTHPMSAPSSGMRRSTAPAASATTAPSTTVPVEKAPTPSSAVPTPASSQPLTSPLAPPAENTNTAIQSH